MSDMYDEEDSWEAQQLREENERLKAENDQLRQQAGYEDPDVPFEDNLDSEARDRRAKLLEELAADYTDASRTREIAEELNSLANPQQAAEWKQRRLEPDEKKKMLAEIDAAHGGEEAKRVAIKWGQAPNDGSYHEAIY